MDVIKLSRASKDIASDFKPDEKRCIICNTSDDSVLSNENGREKIKEAAKIRNDIVTTRLNSLSEAAVFYYHVNNACYKQYCHKKSLLKIQSEKERLENEDKASPSQSTDEENVRKPARKRARHYSPEARITSNLDRLCIICNQKSHKQIYHKYRICEYPRAEGFLKATLYLQDDVFTRTCDLQDVSSVFGADLLCHDNCISGYLLKYKRKLQSDSKSTPQVSEKVAAFTCIAHDIKSGLDKGQGYTLSYIRDQFNIHNEHVKVSNKELKLMLCDHFGNGIKFSKPIEANKPLMFFSSALQTEEVADVIRSCNPVTECAILLREALEKLDFGLNDKFGDAQDLRSSWTKSKIPDVFVNFFSTLFNVDPKSLAECNIRENEDEELEQGKHSQNWNLKAQTLLQIMHYNMYRGARKTPLHMMIGESIHEKCKSKTLITSFNHAGLSVSYPEVIRHHHNLAQYVIRQSPSEVPIPSHFKTDSYTIGAFDNFDHEEATLSGVGGSHDTVCVLFQDKPLDIPGKPYLSETGVIRGIKAIQELLPCQKLQPYIKPAKRPDLPGDYEVTSDLFAMNQDEKKQYEKLDMLWQFSRIAQTIRDSSEISNPEENLEQPVPSWSAFNALCSKEDLLVKQVGFLPVIPYPVTKHATVYTALLNFNSILEQLDQNYLPVACDEGVYAIAREIQLVNQEKFKNIVLLLGAFHMAKILLRCLGKYVLGSGVSNVFIECSVFGVNVVQSVLEGKNYVRGVKGMLMLGETMFRLQVKSFLKEHSYESYASDVEQLLQIHRSISSAREKTVDHVDLDINVEKLLADFEKFIDRGRQTSEQFLYWDNFLRLLQLLRNLVRSDRQGIWELHLDTVQKLQPVFAVFDCVNYQRWSSLYLEDMRRLPKTAPEAHKMFLKGKHVVKRYEHTFTAVAADMALEQTINRSQKSSSGIIGHTKQKQFVAEWEITHHERLMISNLFREVTDSISLVEGLNIHHEFSKSQTQSLDAKVNSMFKYILQRGNPFDMIPNPLHNLVTKALVSQDTKEKILNLLQTGDSLYSTHRKGRYEDKTTRISSTIHKVMLPAFDSNKTPSTCVTGKSSKKKSNSSAHRMIQIAQAREYDMQELFRYDLSDNSSLFDEQKLPRKAQKSALLKELEASYSSNINDKLFQADEKTCYVVDVMNSLRKVMTNENKTFGGTASAFSSYVQGITKNCGRVDYVFDSYHKLSPKQPERLQRQGGGIVIDITEITEEVPLPVQLSSFWGSSKNKLILQEFIANKLIASLTQTPCTTTHTFSAFSGDEQDEMSFNCTSVQNGIQVNHQELSCLSVEEADFRMIIHSKHASQHGFTKIVLVSADTDIMVLALFHWATLLQLGVQEMWVRTGVGDSTRLLPVHAIHEKTGQVLCSLLPAIHALSGADYTSKFGTKKAALKIASVPYLENFGVSPDWEEIEKSLQPAEEYLVQLLRKGSPCKSLDELRLWLYHHGKNTDIEDLPPTSRSAKGHLLRSYFYTYLQRHCIDDMVVRLDPCEFGFEVTENGLLPQTNLKKYPSDFIGACSCVKCAKSSCTCRTNEVTCCSFCKCRSVKGSVKTCKNPF